MCRRECGQAGSAAVEQAVRDVKAVVSERYACKRIGISRTSFQRHAIGQAADELIAAQPGELNLQHVSDISSPVSRQVRRLIERRQAKGKRLSAPRALSPEQRRSLLNAIHQPRFVDRSVPYIYATLLDENLYYGSISTMYRVLHSVGEVGDRRDQATRPAYVKPELCAIAPNQVYAWDITKLHGPQKWTYFYLYTVIDIFSRYGMGWMVADRESSALAKVLLKTTIREQRCDPTRLTVHADRGSSMKSKPVAFMLADLGVTKTHSRPHVSNDNPQIESLFKTVKYQPKFPATFVNLIEARLFCSRFFRWYNNEHRHSSIALLTPSDVHYGRVEEKTVLRQAVLDRAYAEHPERFVNGRPRPLRLAPASYINRPTIDDKTDSQAAVA